MKRSSTWWLSLLSLAAGMLALPRVEASPVDRDGRAADTSARECREPHPCDGRHWPPGLKGREFELASVERVRVERPDGTVLEGWIGMPAVPPGVDVPVVLHSSPYLGVCRVEAAECIPGPATDAFWSGAPGTDATRTWGVPPLELVQHGYAAAFFSLRGTGGSSGCGDLFGPAEQADQVALVDWLASRDWSNGRVGMGGNSLPGITPWEAAIHAPEGLKTIVTAGIIADLYTAVHSPQGALVPNVPARFDELFVQNSLLPHLGNGSDAAGEVASAPERLCEQQLSALFEGHRGHLADERDPSVWKPRRLLTKFPDVTAAVLLAHGLQDTSEVHSFQEDVVWEALTKAPKWQIAGQWGHGPPFATQPALNSEWIEDNWSPYLFAWLDYWLKGVGEPPALGQVDWQDSAGDWHTSAAWPPPGSHDEALFLAGTALSPRAGDSERSFTAALSVHNDHQAAEDGHFPHSAISAVCRPATGPGVDDLGVAWVSEPIVERTLVAGNPFAYLTVSSTLPGGVFGVQLLRVPASANCDDPSQWQDWLSRGAIDLRFHDGNDTAEDFPILKRTPVRVDLPSLATVFDPGDRLAVVISGADRHLSQPHYVPRITIHGASHVVIPVFAGGFGGASADIDYPPRPFLPTK